MFCRVVETLSTYIYFTNTNSSKTLHIISREQPQYLIHTSIMDDSTFRISNHISPINHHLNTPYILSYIKLYDLYWPDQPLLYTPYSFGLIMIAVPCLRFLLYIYLYTGYTQKNGAVSMVNKGKPHHSFVYTLYTVRPTLSLHNTYCFGHNFDTRQHVLM